MGPGPQPRRAAGAEATGPESARTPGPQEPYLEERSTAEHTPLSTPLLQLPARFRFRSGASARGTAPRAPGGVAPGS